MEKLLSIRKAAEALGVTPDTLRAWDESGTLKAMRTEGGHRRYSQADINLALEKMKMRQGRSYLTVIYSRVLATDKDQQGELDRQKAKSLEHCSAMGYQVDRVFDEIESAPDTYCQEFAKLLKLVAGGKVERVVIEASDRLAGNQVDFETLRILFESLGTTIEVAELRDKS